VSVPDQRSVELEIVRVVLNATGQRLLTRLHKLPAELTVIDGTKKLSRQSLTFKAAKKKT
jgi:hypothetical protein